MIYDHSYAGMNVVEVGGGGVHEENVGKLGGADGYNSGVNNNIELSTFATSSEAENVS